MRFYLCLVLIFGVVLSAGAETLYIDDMVRVGIRDKPRSSEQPLMVATTGMKVEVLERDGRYIRVRTEDGVEGWMNKLYAVEEPPARITIVSLQQEHEQLQEQHEEVQQRLADLQQEEQSFLNRISELTSENGRLEAEVKAYQKAETSPFKRYAWLITLGTMLGLFLLGVYLGVAWYKQRIAQRMGGLEL